MRAGDIRGRHPRWERYLNGPRDRAALQQVRGIGLERSALILRLYGSIDGFLQADPSDIATHSHGLIGERLAARLQAGCIDAGLRSDWSHLEEANQAARPEERGLLDRVMAWLVAENPVSPADRPRWSFARVGQAWAFAAPWGLEGDRNDASSLRPTRS